MEMPSRKELTNMKKTALLLLTAALALTMTACHSAPAQEDTLSDNSVVSQATTPDPSSSADIPDTSSSSPSASAVPSDTSATSKAASQTESTPSIDEPSEESVTTASRENSPAEAASSESTTSQTAEEPEQPSETPEPSREAPVVAEPVSESTSSLPEESESNRTAQPSQEPAVTPKTDSTFLNVWTKVYAIDLYWEPQENADGYILQCSDSSRFPQGATITQQTADCTMTFDDLTPNTTYYVRARTYQLHNGEKVYSDWYQPSEAPLKTIEVIDGITYVDGTLIANKTYSLPEYYGYGLTDETYQACNEMIAAAAEDGIYLWIESGFRSYETQSYTYQSFVWDRGTELADLCSARPGHSEHQSGMAIDFNTTSDAFAYTPEAAWIAAHCAEFGFIIRYPQGKESITGYKYEPWHVRYIGREKAAAVTASGLTLEEYYGITSFYQD